MMSVELVKEQKQSQALHHRLVVDAVDQDFKQSDKGHLQYNKFVEIVMVLVQL